MKRSHRPEQEVHALYLLCQMWQTRIWVEVNNKVTYPIKHELIGMTAPLMTPCIVMCFMVSIADNN